MSRRRELESNASISSGSSSTSNALELDDHTTATLEFEGDAESKNLNIFIQAKFDESDAWGRYDKIKEVYLTDADNNTKIFPYDVLDLEKLRVKTENNGNKETAVSIIASKTLHQ